MSQKVIWVTKKTEMADYETGCREDGSVSFVSVLSSYTQLLLPKKPLKPRVGIPLFLLHNLGLDVFCFAEGLYEKTVHKPASP